MASDVQALLTEPDFEGAGRWSGSPRSEAEHDFVTFARNVEVDQVYIGWRVRKERL